MLTLTFLQNLLPHQADDIALDDGDTAVSYEEVVTATNALAVALQNKDPIPGSRVALCATPGLEYLISALAIQASGKILVPMSPSSDPQTLYNTLVRTLPSTVIVDAAGDAALRCEDALKITFDQFEGLVRTYRGQTPQVADISQITADLPVVPEIESNTDA